MPVDPNIALSYNPQPVASPLEQLGALSNTVGKWAEIQNQINQARLFQQTQAARYRAGEILSSSPDLNTAIQGLTSDPLVAPYAAETINTLRQSQLAMIQGQGALMEQRDKGLQAVMKGLGEVAVDPTQETWDKAVGGRLGLLNPAIRGEVALATDSIRDSLITNLPDDPQKRLEVFNGKLQGALLGAGFTPEAVTSLMGGVLKQDTGTGTAFGRQAPLWAGGGAEFKTFLPKGLEPQVTKGPGEIPITVGGSAQPPVPVPFGAPGQSQSSQNPLGAAPVQLRGTQPAGTGPAPGPAELSGTGQPLFSGPMKAPEPAARGIGGLPAYAPGQLKRVEKLADDFADIGAKTYQSALRNMSQLTYMNNTLDEMAAKGGFLVPGSGANFRLEIAKGVNLMAQMAGVSPPFDTKTIAGMEEFNKETKRMGLDVLTQSLGAQREAAQIILGITASVPGVENTYLGGKLVARGLQAVAQRAIDQYKFQDRWQAQNQGNLDGSDVAFNKRFPPEAYAKAVLAEMNMTSKGFASAEAKAQAQRLGYLTPVDKAEPATGKPRRPLADIFGAP